MILRGLIGLGLAVVHSGFSYAEDDAINIYAAETNLSLSAEKSGFFYDIAMLVLPGGGAPYKFIIVPHIRSAHLFAADKKSCRFPSNVGVFNSAYVRTIKAEYIETLPFIRNSIRIFSQLGTEPPSSGEQLIGKKIAVPLGSIYHKKFGNIGATIIRTETDKQRTQMLLSGRVDYMMASMPTVGLVFRSLGVDTLPFDPSLSALDFTLHLSCHNTPRNASFVENVDAKLREIEADGRLQALYKEHGLDYTLDD